MLTFDSIIMNWYLLLNYFTLGAIGGFLSSTPLGPINFWVADHKLSKYPRAHLYSFLAAVIIIDLIYAGSAMRFHFDVLEEKTEIKWMGIFSGIFTTLMGTALLTKAISDNILVKVVYKNRAWKSFFQGLLLTAINPAFLIFWLFVANQIISRMDNRLNVIELFFYLIGVLGGDLIWFASFGWILSHLEKKSQESTLKKIRVVVSLIFILIGLLATGSYAIK